MSADDSNETTTSRSVPSGLLLGSLLLSLILIPMLEHLGSHPLLMRGLMTLSIVIAVYTVRKQHVLSVPILVLAGIAVPVAWISVFVDSPVIFLAHCLLISAFFWTVGGIVVVVSFKQRFATLDAVLGAISAYLLFGLAWAFMYWALAQATPHAFKWPEEMNMGTSAEPIHLFPKVVYYSMVTMSTLGYGDVTPVSNIACTLAWMQSVTGQFYVAVLVAWLVSALPRPELIETKVVTKKSV